jgi:hypothetical protein
MVPLMEAALEEARRNGPRDRVAAGLASYLERHIPEEIHSDEPGGAVLDDFAALGGEPANLRRLPTTHQVSELVATQLRWIHFEHPVSILGFLELEAHQANRTVIERLIKATGLPRGGFGQLLLHARLDVAHARDLHRVLDSLPLTRAQEVLIARSAVYTMVAVTDALLDVLLSNRKGGSKKPPYRSASIAP